jgi:ferric-dicitrate binding protein FerR (iron transport regulator)
MSAQPHKHRAAPARQKRQSSLGGRRGGLAYLIVLGGVAVGLLFAWHGTTYGYQGTEVVGWALIAAALARLVLPPRYAGLLASRRKAIDVLAFALLGGSIVGLAVWLSSLRVDAATSSSC